MALPVTVLCFAVLVVGQLCCFVHAEVIAYDSAQVQPCSAEVVDVEGQLFLTADELTLGVYLEFTNNGEEHIDIRNSAVSIPFPLAQLDNELAAVIADSEDIVLTCAPGGSSLQGTSGCSFTSETFVSSEGLTVYFDSGAPVLCSQCKFRAHGWYAWLQNHATWWKWDIDTILSQFPTQLSLQCNFELDEDSATPAAPPPPSSPQVAGTYRPNSEELTYVNVVNSMINDLSATFSIEGYFASQTSAGVRLELITDAQEVLVAVDYRSADQFNGMPCQDYWKSRGVNDQCNCGTWSVQLDEDIDALASFGDGVSSGLQEYSIAVQQQSVERKIVVNFPYGAAVDLVHVRVVPEDAVVKAVPKQAKQKLIVYGDSIVAGYCASSGGRIWSNWLGHLLDADITNIAFEGRKVNALDGNTLGEMPEEAPIISMIGVNDMNNNSPLETFEEYFFYFVKAIRESKPFVPIVHVAPLMVELESIVPAVMKQFNLYRGVIKHVTEQWVAAGDTNIHYIELDILNDANIYVDGLHPTDEGMKGIATHLAQQLTADMLQQQASLLDPTALPTFNVMSSFALANDKDDEMPTITVDSEGCTTVVDSLTLHVDVDYLGELPSSTLAVRVELTNSGDNPVRLDGIHMYINFPLQVEDNTAAEPSSFTATCWYARIAGDTKLNPWENACEMGYLQGKVTPGGLRIEMHDGPDLCPGCVLFNTGTVLTLQHNQFLPLAFGDPSTFATGVACAISADDFVDPPDMLEAQPPPDTLPTVPNQGCCIPGAELACCSTQSCCPMADGVFLECCTSDYDPTLPNVPELPSPEECAALVAESFEQSSLILDELCSGCTLRCGTAGNDILAGTDACDCIFGFSGSDVLEGGAGADILFGGPDSDQIMGGDGEDLIYAGEGSDWVTGGANNDVIYGEDGDDTVFGGPGVDVLYGNNSNDLLYGDEAGDVLYGGYGDDILYGGEGSDELFGQLGSDGLYGEDNDDTLVGGKFHPDVLTGGEGADTYYRCGVTATSIPSMSANDKVVEMSGTLLCFV